MVMCLSREIRNAFDQERSKRWDRVKIRFSWVGEERDIVTACLSTNELRADWHGERKICPGKNTVIFNIYIGDTPVPEEVSDGIRFEEFLEAIEKTWRSKKRGAQVKNDLAGQRFGLLTAIRPTDERRFSEVVWECVCDCGNTKFVPRESLVKEATRSCGCLRCKRGKKIDT